MCVTCNGDGRDESVSGTGRGRFSRFTMPFEQRAGKLFRLCNFLTRGIVWTFGGYQKTEEHRKTSNDSLFELISCILQITADHFHPGHLIIWIKSDSCTFQHKQLIQALLSYYSLLALRMNEKVWTVPTFPFKTTSILECRHLLSIASSYFRCICKNKPNSA